MEDFFILKDIDEKLHALTSQVSYVYINPINLEEEHELVLKDPDYNPQFRYSKINFDAEKIIEELDLIDKHDSEFGELLEKKKRNFQDKADMFFNLGQKKFSVYSKKSYGMPTTKTLRKAAELLLLESDKQEKTISAEKAMHKIKSELNHYGFEYTVGLKEMSATASVLVNSRKLFLKKGYMLSPNYVDRLIIHEIGTHVLRAENGSEQPFKMFRQGFPNYLNSEEGLAVYNEERFGFLLKEDLKNYAARAIAVHMAKTQSFSKIYNYLLEFFSETWAFRLTARVKRGISDTSRPGGVTRDYSYLEGYMRIKAHMEKAEYPDIEMQKLYTGKIGLEHLHVLDTTPGIIPAKRLPKNQRFKSLDRF